MITSFPDIEGTERVFRAYEHTAVIVLRSFGYKTRKSTKKTWNEALLVRGPKEWVEKEWRKMAALRKIQLD